MTILSLPLFLVALLVICYIYWHPLRQFEIVIDTAQVSKWGEERTLVVTSNVADSSIDIWTDDEWITVTRGEGEEYSIVFANNPEEYREGTIYAVAYSTIFGLRYKSYYKEIKISQEPGFPSFLTIDKRELAFDNRGNPHTKDFLTIKGDGVSAESFINVDWITLGSIDVPPNTSDFSVEIPVKVKVNPTDYRAADVVIISGGLKETLRISQDSGLATYIRLDQTSMRLSEDAFSFPNCYFCRVITDGTSWSISSYPDWLSVTADNDSNLIRIETHKNNGEVRRGSIVVRSNNGHSAEVSVTQNGSPTRLSAGRNSINVGINGGYETVEIYNDSFLSLTATVPSPEVSWLSVYVVGDSVRIFYSENESSPRSGYVNVYCGNKECSIRVLQAGWENCRYCGGKGYTTCSANGSWMNQFGTYLYKWESGRHVIQRIYTDYQYDPWTNSTIPVPATSYADCDRCGGSGTVKCTHCNGSGRSVVSAY